MGGKGHPGILSPAAQGQGAGSSNTWTALGPMAVQTAPFGLVSGRISAIALDPSDQAGGQLYVGTTGGGVWFANNAAASDLSTIDFTPLTDSLSAFGNALDTSISIGALTVQPGGTGVILAGTGDANDVLDSYYGAGILRSADSGQTWSLITRTNDIAAGEGVQNYGFAGEGFAGFAWSDQNPQLVVAAVSQAYEGELVDAVNAGASTQGLYYSNDSGATWHLACIADGTACSPGSGTDVQGPLDAFPKPDGNAATAVVWNKVRGVFIAAVRYHGYYQSSDGMTWTRMTAQPGATLTTSACPTDTGYATADGCPIFRGALAVNPVTGDTFAWTVDLNDQDQGLYEGQCLPAGGPCASGITWQQWNTQALESDTPKGPATVADGTYNLTLAAMPAAGQGSMVLAGANDLWQATCPLSQGAACAWRNTTNATTCMSAKVGEFQHALAWDGQNPLEIFLGNDSGLWRSLDGIAESGTQCDPLDDTHFQNLNGGLGSLAEVESISQVDTSPYWMMAGLGVNGAAGEKSGALTADWPQVLGGYGGPVAIDPTDSSNWYVNDQLGVAIYRCAQPSECTPSSFGSTAVVTEKDVFNDGYPFQNPAPFLVDPVDPSQLIVGTCLAWRGPASGTGWSKSSAVTRTVDTEQTLSDLLQTSAGTDQTPQACTGNALIRLMAAVPVTGTNKETIYAGTYGSANGGATLPGHVLSVTFDPSASTIPKWQDLTANPVENDKVYGFNHYGFDISSITIDAHDASGKTVYATIGAVSEVSEVAQTVYRSTDGGATWNTITANLPNAPANAVAIDPQNANTVYVATDRGVYYTTEVAACAQALSNCWSAFGTGLPEAPVVALSAAPSGSSSPVLVAGTYGRGMWQTPLWTAGTSLSAASAAPSALTFSNQVFGTTSAAQSVTITNTGSVALLPTAPSFSGDQNDFNVAAGSNCIGQSIAAGGTCTLQVTFAPQGTGPRTARMIVYANVYGGQLAVDLNGTGLACSNCAIELSAASLPFGQVAVGVTKQLSVTLTNPPTSSPAAIGGIAAAAPFAVAANTNSCGATLAPNNSCAVWVAFTPTQTGPATGVLTLSGNFGTQTVQLSGTGAAAPTDDLSTTSIAFAATASGQVSAAQPVTITNNGDLPLHVTSIAASANFQESSGCLSGVAAHDSCSVSVQFAPTQTGPLTGTLTIVDELGTKTVGLSGTGLQPAALTVSPPSLTFSQQQPGVASAAQTVTVTNSGGVAMASIGFQISGPGAASYAWSASTCGALLNPGAQCTVQIAFTPPGTGTSTAALGISTSTPGVTGASVPLNGTGQLTSGLQSNPGQIGFATAIGVGQSSTAQSVTVTNTSNYSVGSVSASATAPFSLTQNTCTGSLSAGASCTATVVFQPAASGAATGTLTVSSGDVKTPATVALTGTGFSFTVAVSGSASQTVSSGQQADYKLAITPNGAQGAFAFQCGTLPAYALCIFNPASETLAGGVVGNVTVEVFTGNSGANARLERPVFGRAWRLVCVLLVLPLALWRRRGLFLVALLAVAFAAGASGCAGAGGGLKDTGGGGSSSSTPPGTYTIPVTVSSTGLTQSVPLTMTVD